MCAVAISIDNPAVDEYVPPVYAPVPVKVTGSAVASEIQNGVPAYVMAAVGTAVIVIYFNDAAAAEIYAPSLLYALPFFPAVLVLGVIAPVVASIDNPAVDEYVPPAYAPVPVKETCSALASAIQNGVPAYVMAAVFTAVIVTDVVTGTAAQPADAGMLYVTVSVPAVLVLGILGPLVASSDNPAVDEYVPPVYAPVPVNVTGSAVASEMQHG